MWLRQREERERNSLPSLDNLIPSITLCLSSVFEQYHLRAWRSCRRNRVRIGEVDLFLSTYLLDMGTLALETKSVGSDTYRSLGLQEVGKENPGIPRVLSLLSSLLERSVQKNEILLETAQIKDVVTIFHGSRAPSLGIQQYIDRIFKYSCCSPSCFVVAHIYVERFIQRMNVHITSLNVHRLLITSVMVAAKFVDDAFFNNAYYARVGGVSTSELNRLEMKFLFGLDFQLHVTVQTFGKYCSLLEKETAAVIQIERPILACGIKESWSNQDCTSTIAQ